MVGLALRAAGMPAQVPPLVAHLAVLHCAAGGGAAAPQAAPPPQQAALPQQHGPKLPRRATRLRRPSAVKVRPCSSVRKWVWEVLGEQTVYVLKKPGSCAADDPCTGSVRTSLQKLTFWGGSVRAGARDAVQAGRARAAVVRAGGLRGRARRRAACGQRHHADGAALQPPPPNAPPACMTGSERSQRSSMWAAHVAPCWLRSCSTRAPRCP